MTLPTIEQLEAMLADATKGPWQRGENGNKRVYGPDGCGEHTGLIVPTVYKANGNAALIALAPTLATQRIADAKRIAELEAALRQAKKYLEHEPEYHDQGMGCGLEDRNITDRYDAMAHGWDQAMERAFSETVAAAVEEINTALEATP